MIYLFELGGSIHKVTCAEKLDPGITNIRALSSCNLPVKEMSGGGLLLWGKR